jgi:hypothetical protein
MSMMFYRFMGTFWMGIFWLGNIDFVKIVYTTIETRVHKHLHEAEEVIGLTEQSLTE